MPGTAMLRRPPLASLLLLIDASAELCAESFATMVDPFVAAGLALPAVNLSVQAIQAVNKYVSRRDRAEDIKTQLRRIQRCYEDLKNMTSTIEHQVSSNVMSQSKFSILMKNAEESIQNVNNWESKILDATPVNRVTRMEQILNQCEQDLKQLLDFCDEKSTTEPGQDIYKRFNTVPLNPPRLLLEYNDPSTCEGKLKAAVLKDEVRNVVGIVAFGDGGVGKTCAIRGLAVDADIEKHFGGGTFYIQLGNSARIIDIIRGLASIVEITGGEKLSVKVQNCKTPQEACIKAGPWFRNQTCLFLIDDIWHRNGIDSEVMYSLSLMVNSKSRLVYTSRDRYFLEEGIGPMIWFEGTEPDCDQSRKMLLLHGGFSEIGELDGENRTAFERILVECKGLPLAFGIAGRAVHKWRNRQETGQEQNAWTDVGKMVSDPQNSLLMRENAQRYGGLNRMVDVSLQVLEEQYGAEYRTKFRALCVLQKQQRQPPPVAMLQKLWGLRSLNETESAAEVLEAVSLLQLKKHNDELCVQLHDLALDIARERAKEADQTQHFHRTLLHNYAPNDEDWWNIEKDGYLHDNLCRLMRCAGSGRDVLQLLSEPKWVVHRLLDGGINKFEQDLEEGKQCLLGGGNDSEHQEFLEMVGRAARLGCTYYERNEREIYFQLYGRLLSHATQNEETRKFLERLENRAPKPWVKASMGLLQQAGSSALESIPGSDGVLSVQYREDAALFIRKSQSALVVRSNQNATSVSEYDFGDVGEVQCAAFLQDERVIVSVHQNKHPENFKIMRWGEEATMGTPGIELNNNREVTETKHRRLGDMCSKCLSSRGSERPQQDEEAQCGRLVVVGFCKQGTLLATADESVHSIQIWDTGSGAAVGKSLRGHTARVRCVSVSADGTRIVSGSEDKTVRVWNANSGEVVGGALREHTGAVLCVALSADGTRIVSGSEDKTVRMWDANSGGPAGEPFRGHTGAVLCVGVSADGTRIVSGSVDKTVRMWDANSGGPAGEPFRGHIGAVLCVDVNADGTRIVSGSLDKTVRMWDANSGAHAGEPLRGHSDEVMCVGVSADGTRIVSGSEDLTLQMWDAKSGAAVKGPLRGHTGVVMCVGVSADGTCIVSGSEDKTVRMWDAESGAAVGEPLCGHSDWVTCVDVSADGTRIVSGSGDKTLRLWEAESNVFVGKHLRGHTGLVTCVALSADGTRIVSGSEDKTLRVWDVESCEAVGDPVDGHTDWVTCVNVSTDGTRIVSGSDDKTARVWEVCSGRQIGVSLLHEESVKAVALSTDGSRVMTVTGAKRMLWDAVSGVCLCTSDDVGWQSAVLNLSFSLQPQLGVRTSRRVQIRDSDDSEITLATFEEDVRNLIGTDVFWGEKNLACVIIRE